MSMDVGFDVDTLIPRCLASFFRSCTWIIYSNLVFVFKHNFTMKLFEMQFFEIDDTFMSVFRPLPF